MRRVLGLFAVLVSCAVPVGCSGDDAAESTTSTTASTTTTTAPETLRILVSNDDGIGSEGLDVLVRGLMELPNVEVSVVAPAENKSGSGDTTTPGGAAYTDGATASGKEGTAVAGFPADTVDVALDELGLEPHVVVSGVNEGQNIGPLASISGTVGVARAAIRRGVPAIAASAGAAFDEAQFRVAVDMVTQWIEDHRAALVAGEGGTEDAVSINVPVCPPEKMGDPVEVPLAARFPDGANPFVSRCDLAGPAPTDDYQALVAGFPALTEVPAELEAPAA